MDGFGDGLLRSAGVTGDSLDLSQKLAGDRTTALRAVVLAMRDSASLTECYLRSNSLGKEGWTAIFTALRDSKVSKISTWYLHSEDGIKESVHALAEYISISASITQACQIRQMMRCLSWGSYE